jgi:hypothetical protein
MKSPIISIVFILFTTLGYAESIDSASVPRPDIRALRTMDRIVVDGILSEDIWRDAPVAPYFIQRDPNEWEPETEKTLVSILYDDDAIYVGARLFDRSPDSIVARLGRKDVEQNSDDFFIALDPYNDHRTGFYFGIDAAGTVHDGVIYNDEWTDNSWDGVWEGRATIDSLGWCAEMRIPFSQLRYHQNDQQIWGIDFRRIIRRKNEESYITFQPKNGSGFTSRFVHLIGIENIKPSRQIEIMPYATTRAEYIHYPSDDPFHNGSKYTPDIGLDLKIGLGSNLTLTGTVNPDFGQVEVDPAVVNLSDVETFYQEKRPFFVEGATIFNFGYGGVTNFWNFNFPMPTFFYTRRIGRAPHGEVPDADYTDVPAGTKILGAAKLTGKLGESWNFGTIQALTGREYARISNSGETSRIEVEPPTYYSVIRAQREFDDSRQGLGFLVNSTLRSFADDRLRIDMNNNSHVFGIDGWTSFDSSKTWVLSGWTEMSHVRGTTDRIIELQENSQHYFQRPDAESYSVDRTATSMTGFAGRFLVNKQKGNVLFNGSFGIINPKFEPNDLGFLSRTDVIDMHVGGGYRWTDVGSFYRQLGWVAAGFQSFNFDGNLTWRGIFCESWIQFLNYYYIDIWGAYNPRTITTRRTRGGPASVHPGGFQTYIYASSDSRQEVIFDTYLNVYNGIGSKNWNSYIGLTWHPMSNISLSFSPSYTRNIENTQWIDVFDDPYAMETYGKRYVFGKMDQTTISANIRLDWTFTPQLSLQLFVQPLISAGDFLEFKELARPGTYDFPVYGTQGSTISLDNGTYIVDPDGGGPAAPFSFDNPQYNYTSIRGNAVLRWEYMPGSVLFLVWTQSRSNDRELGQFQLGPSAEKLWRMVPDNIFMIKMSYWWNQ